MPSNRRKKHEFANWVTEHAIFKRQHPVFQTNFAGRLDPWGNSRRNFCIRIDDSKVAQRLMDAGWRINPYTNRETDEVEFYFMRVNVSFDNPTKDPARDKDFIPVIKQVTESGVVTYLDEETVGLLDDQDILWMNVDVRPYNSYNERNDTEQVVGYLSRLLVKVKDDIFDDDFSDDGPSEVIFGDEVYGDDGSVRSLEETRKGESAPEEDVDDEEIPF